LENPFEDIKVTELKAESKGNFPVSEIIDQNSDNSNKNNMHALHALRPCLPRPSISLNLNLKKEAKKTSKESEPVNKEDEKEKTKPKIVPISPVYYSYPSPVFVPQRPPYMLMPQPNIPSNPYPIPMQFMPIYPNMMTYSYQYRFPNMRPPPQNPFMNPRPN